MDGLPRGTASVGWPMELRELKAGWLAWKPGDRHHWADWRPLMIRIQLQAFVWDECHRWPQEFVTGE